MLHSLKSQFLIAIFKKGHSSINIQKISFMHKSNTKVWSTININEKVQYSNIGCGFCVIRLQAAANAVLDSQKFWWFEAILLRFFNQEFKMNTKMTKLTLALGAIVMAASASAVAATDTANLAMSATVNTICAIGPGAISFGTLTLDVNAGAGTVTLANHDADSGSSISIACTNGSSAAITAGAGSNSAGATRNMISGSDLLAYELYTNAGRGIVLNGTNSIAYTGTGAATTTDTIFARITGAQLAAAKKGSYADTVAMTITYTP